MLHDSSRRGTRMYPQVVGQPEEDRRDCRCYRENEPREHPEPDANWWGYLYRSEMATVLRRVRRWLNGQRRWWTAHAGYESVATKLSRNT
jgi:hypothetical protein